MIHTDGRPTIASYGSPIGPVQSGPVETVADIPVTEERQLLERDAAGLNVQLVLIGENLVVRVTEARDSAEERTLIGVVPPNKALDAFEHPYLYV